MRDMLKVQEHMDICLDQRDEELRQLRSQSQSDGAQLAALSLQMQELISSVESRAKVVGKDLEEINGQFNCHRGEINRLRIREKDSKEEVEKLKGFIVSAGHEAQVFKNRLDRMEENICRCGWTPSEVGEEFVSSEDKGRTELSYASAIGEEYMAPPVENSIPLPIPAPASCCLGPTATIPPMEEICKEPTFICEDLDGLLREADKGRARDLQEGSSQSVVRSPSRLGSERWKRLNGIHHASRAREKGAEGNLFLSLYQKGFLKMFWRASGSRRIRRICRVFTSLRTGSNQHRSSQGRWGSSFQLVWATWSGPLGRGAYQAAWCRAWSLDLRST